MTNSGEEEVKEFNETIEIKPSPDNEDDEIIEPVPIEEKETPTPSSEDEQPVEEEQEEEIEEAPIQAEEPEEVKGPKPVEGETPREKALRLETARLKGLLRKERQEELFVKQPTSKHEEDLSEYDPEELKRFETLAIKMGFAKKDEIMRDSVQEKNSAEFDTFIEAHPEYSPENDPDGTLWNTFKSEFALYQPPQDPKTLRKVLNKVHNEIYGVQPASNLNKINAQQQKLKVASHTGSQASSRVSEKAPVKAPNTNIRLDMLKGFDEDEMKELGA